MHPGSINIYGSPISVISGIGQMLIVKRYPSRFEDVALVVKIYKLLRPVVEPAIADKTINSSPIQVVNMLL